MIAKIDTQVGQIVDLLREQEIKDNTLLFFGSDHGAALADGNRLAVVVLCAGKKVRCMKAVCVHL